MKPAHGAEFVMLASGGRGEERGEGRGRERIGEGEMTRTHVTH